MACQRHPPSFTNFSLWAQIVRQHPKQPQMDNHTTHLFNCHNGQDVEPRHVTTVNYLNGIHICAVINNLKDNNNKCTGIKSTLPLIIYYYSDMFQSSSEDDLKKIKTHISISRLYVKVYFQYLCICWHCLLTCKLL
jgi:hypothetical protein